MNYDLIVSMHHACIMFWDHLFGDIGSHFTEHHLMYGQFML